MAGVIEEYPEHHLPVAARHAFIPLDLPNVPGRANLVSPAREGKDGSSSAACLVNKRISVSMDKDKRRLKLSSMAISIWGMHRLVLFGSPIKTFGDDPLHDKGI